MITSQELKGILQGPVVAMTTPFNEDLSLDEGGVRTLIDFYCDTNAGPVIVGGSSGEFFSMTEPERKRLLEVAIDQNRGRLPIIAGCAHSGTTIALDLVMHGKEVGAVGAMVTPPYYGFSGFEGLYRHYQILNDECDLGILIYFSSAVLHLVQDIISKPELLGKLAELPHISGFKDSTNNFWFLRDISINLKGKISILASAGLSYYLWGYDYGTPGWITGIGNIWPGVEREFWGYIQEGNRDAAQEIAFNLDRPYLNYIKDKPKRYGYFAAVKALLNMEGLPGGYMRPPLLDWPQEDYASLGAEMKRIGLLQAQREPVPA
jgi:dihydrodipicolinate synthase/N-acetylneuraminate lyase